MADQAGRHRVRHGSHRKDHELGDPRIDLLVLVRAPWRQRPEANAFGRQRLGDPAVGLCRHLGKEVPVRRECVELAVAAQQ